MKSKEDFLYISFAINTHTFASLPLLICLPFTSSCPCFQLRTAGAVLSRSGEESTPTSCSRLRGRAFNFWPLSVKLTVRSSWQSLCWGMFLPCPICWVFLTMNGCWILSSTFRASLVTDPRRAIFHSIHVVSHIIDLYNLDYPYKSRGQRSLVSCSPWGHKRAWLHSSLYNPGMHPAWLWCMIFAAGAVAFGLLVFCWECLFSSRIWWQHNCKHQMTEICPSPLGKLVKQVKYHLSLSKGGLWMRKLVTLPKSSRLVVTCGQKGLEPLPAPLHGTLLPRYLLLIEVTSPWSMTHLSILFPPNLLPLP